MKKTRSLDRDGLDGILQTAIKPQPKADNRQANSDKTQAKSVRGKVAWLLTGLGALLAGGVLLKVLTQNPPSDAPVAASGQSTTPALASLDQQTGPATVLAQSEPSREVGATQAAAESPRAELANANPDNLHANEAVAGQTPSANQRPAESAGIPELPSEPTSAGVKKSPDTVTEPAPAQALFTVRFKFDSSKLAPMAQAESTELINAAKACQGRLSLVGHTCNLGPDASNVQLGRARANALKKWLVGKGIAAERIVTASEGMRKPAAANDTKAGQALNRRAELYCLDQ